MRNLIIIFAVLFYMNTANSNRLKKNMIKDPINSKYECVSHNVKWKGNMLVSTGNSYGSITCEHTGYIAFIFGEDNLSKAEIISIKSFLKFARNHLNIKKGNDFSQLAMIDNLWLLKNIYERRNLTPEQHIKIIGIFKEFAFTLIQEAIIDQQELKNFCIGKDDEDRWCRSKVLKFKAWEESIAIAVDIKKSNRDAKLLSQSIKIKQRNIETKELPNYCASFDLARHLSMQVMKNRLKSNITYERDIDMDSEAESSNGDSLYTFVYKRTGNFKTSNLNFWKVSINKGSCETKVSPGRWHKTNN